MVLTPKLSLPRSWVVVTLAALTAPQAVARPLERISAQPARTRLSQTRVLPYPVEQVWTTAVRFLRIDRDYTIVDRDRQTGYVVFEFPLNPEVTRRGALEAFPTTDAAGRASTQVKISTEAGPPHLPNALLDGIAQKLRTERGQAAPPPPPKPPPDPPPDDGQAPKMPPPVDPSELLLP